MISDGIENCLQYLDNLAPKKNLKVPFAYFTQIIYYAFIRRIQKEKKQVVIKQKLLRDSNFDDLAFTTHGDDSDYTNQFTEFLRQNTTEEDTTVVTKKEKKTKKQKR